MPSHFSRSSACFWGPLCATLVLGWGIASKAAIAEDSSEDVWLISTRNAARSGKIDQDSPKVEFYRLGEDRKWIVADRKAFLGHGDANAPTTFFIHGNRVGPHAAIRDGWHVLRQMKKAARGQPFRFVIWSWPSDRICGRQRYDVQVKARYSDGQSCYLAGCLDDVQPSGPVSLIGYSFGARIISGALEMLAGGSVAGRKLAQDESAEIPDAQRAPIRAVLVAAAMDAGWLLPGRRNGRATSRVDRMLITRNGCDPILRWYPRIYGLRGPEAIGYVGAYCCGQSCEKIEEVDLSYAVGDSHDWPCYVQSSPLQKRLAWYTFLAPNESENGPNQPDE